MSNYNWIKHYAQDRIDHIVLARPDKRNAMNPEMVKELREAVSDSAKDPETRALLLKAEGKAFSAGADLEYIQQMQQFSYQDNIDDSRSMMSLFQDLYYHPKLTVAQVQGPAIAGGCGLATLADFIFSVPEAQFGYTEARIGFLPAMVMVFLIRKVGENKARQLLLTGKLISSEAAREMGLIYRVTDQEKIENEVQSFIEDTITRTSGDSIAYIRQMIGEVQNLRLDEALDYAAEKNAMARNTEDCKNGIAAFLNKEPIRW